MPKFIDYHAQVPQLPPEAVQQMIEMIQAGQPDEFGVKLLNVFVGKSGEAYCLTDAPNAQSVCQAHESGGVQLSRSDVHEVNSLV